MTVVLKNEAQNKILWLLILWNVLILKYHEIHTGEKPFVCRMCEERVWNVMRRYTQEKCLLLAGCGMRHFEMLGGYTHRRKALYLQDVMCDETFWNITRRYTWEKSPLPAGCVKRHSVNIMRRYTQERGMWDKTFANQKCHAKIHMIKALCLQEVRQDILKHH